MDNSKKAAFVRKMGKKRLKLAGGGILGLFGGAGGLGGTGFNTQAGTDAGQLADAYKQNQNALSNQAALTSTLTPQAASAVNAQNVLSGQFAGQARGEGPNVAANVLNQATGANVANQAALMAGQRGVSANPALIARQAAQVGAQAQQQAAGQAATTQAQQQIAAEQAQAQLAANQISQTQGATTANTQANQNEQNILQNANTSYNNIQGQLANTTMQGQQGILGGIGNAIGGVLGLAEGGEVSADHPAHPSHGHKKLDFIHKMAKMGMEHFDSGGIAVPQVTVNTPQESFQPIASTQGGFTPTSNAGAEALGKMGAHHEKKKAEPVALGTTSVSTNPNITGGNVNSDLIQSVQPVMAGSAAPGPFELAAKGGEVGNIPTNFVANYLMEAHGGKVPAMVSPGEVYLPPDKVAAVVKQGANPLEIGERIPGKAKVKGDSYKNDTVPKDLDEGGVVVDRKNAMDPKKASKFVQKSIAKRKAKKGGSK